MFDHRADHALSELRTARWRIAYATAELHQCVRYAVAEGVPLARIRVETGLDEDMLRRILAWESTVDNQRHRPVA